MEKVGIAQLPLHYGKCPIWLFNRMVNLTRAIAKIITHEYSEEEFLRRISDPFFFQSLGCVVGYDWHSSGVTTTLCGALKEAMNETGIIVCGGKGRASKKTPIEIKERCKTDILSKIVPKLIYASKMCAKVDSALIQDNYQIYHHSFFVTQKGAWAVIQQGMCIEDKTARRYHWLSENVKSFVEEPNLVVGENKKEKVLNMVAKESEECRKTSVDLVNDNPEHLRRYLPVKQRILTEYFGKIKVIKMPFKHEITRNDLSERTIGILKKAYEIQPRKYEELVAIDGVGPKTIRALALISELIYGASPSWEDPVKYSFAHGGKDGFPYRINKKQYDKSIQILNDAIKNAEIGDKEKLNAIKRLNDLLGKDIK